MHDFRGPDRRDPSRRNTESSLLVDLLLRVRVPPNDEGGRDVRGLDAVPHLTFKEEKTRLLEAWEPEYLRELLEEVEGNLTVAARTAGIARAHLYRLLKKYRLAR